MATSDTYTLVISDSGVPSAHAASHTAGGGDEIAVALSQIDDIAANTVLGNVTGATAAVTAVATTGTGNVVRASGPTVTLANATGLPLTTGVTGVLPAANGGTGLSALGAGIAAFLGTPTSANLRTAVTDETGTGKLVFGTDPVISLTNAAGLPLTTGVTGILPAENGGTGLGTYSAGDLIYAADATTLTTLPGSASGDVLLAGGGAPEWGKVTLTDHVSGTLPVTNGGTSITTYVTGDLLYASGTTTLSRLAAGTANKVLLSGTAPSWGQVPLTTHVSGVLPIANGGTSYSTHSYGQLYMQGGTASTTVSNSVFVKASGTNTTFDSGNSSGFSDGGSIYRLRYTASSTRRFMVYCAIDITASAANKTIALALAKNGDLIAASECRANTTGDADGDVNDHMAKLTTNWIIELASNDHVEPYITIYDSAGSLAVTIRRCKFVVTPV